MTSDRPVAARYFEHLSAGDVAFLAGAAGRPAEQLRAEPRLVLDVLSRPGVFDAAFPPGGGGDGPPVSPFLLFAVAVARAEAELRHATFVPDWFGPRQRVAVFDAPALRKLLGDPAVRLFLAELLTSYTHVASGSVWVPRRGGWRRERFSELDPVRLAALLDVAPERERAGIYRRLGDLALFLTGVFPDHVGNLLSPVDAGRLRRAASVGEPGEADGAAAALSLWEELGRRWYELAGRTAPARTEALDVAVRVGRRFPEARRVLNFVTDRWLFPLRERWFPAAGT